MSTLKVTTIQDTSGGNASTSEQIAQGRAKAWINFNGTGTVAIRDSFNVSSLTDNGTGDYSMNFSSAMSDANYCDLTLDQIKDKDCPSGKTVYTVDKSAIPTDRSFRNAWTYTE
jgi:hypothetical protein